MNTHSEPRGFALRRRVLAALGCATLAIGTMLSSAPADAQGAVAGEKIIISGASGNLGGLTVEALLARGVPASRLILVSRTPDEQKEYAAMGASVRFGDFTKPESLQAAYAGARGCC